MLKNLNKKYKLYLNIFFIIKKEFKQDIRLFQIKNDYSLNISYIIIYKP